MSKTSFSNLFSKLSAIDENVRSPDRSGFTSRKQTENDGGARGRKRKSEGEQRGSNLKRRCFQSQNTAASDAFRGNDSQATQHQKHRDSPSAGRAEGTRTNHKQSRGGQNYKHVKKNQKKKTEKYEQRCRNRRYENGRWRRDETKQDKPRFMSQEFKDQNALLVDGQLVCRHFLYRRCIKENACQLLHIQGYNGLIKEPCKFYIQGFCQNAERCIFMHKSFPCKFFHRWGKCLQEENCRFSHDPLDDVTEKLLDEQEKRSEVIKEGKEEEETKEEETETRKDPDLLTERLRPSFYSSIDAEEEPEPHETEGPAADSAEPHSPPSQDQNHQEPVCYSVEAVLGPQLSRTFSSFSKTPGSQESDEPVSFSKQSEVPYSVDAVLRLKSASTARLYTPRGVSETGGPQNKTLSEKYKEKSCQENRFKRFLSSGVNADAASEGLKERAAEGTHQEDKPESSPPVSAAETSAASRTEGNMNLLTGGPCFQKPPSDLRVLSKPPPSDVGEVSASDTSVAATVGVHRFAAKQLVEVLRSSKQRRPVVKPAAPQITPKSRSEASNAVDPNRTWKSPLAERPAAGSEGLIKPGNSSSFLSLFAAPLGGPGPGFQPQTPLAARKPGPTASASGSVSSGLRTEPPVTSQSLRSEAAAAKQVATPVSCRPDSSCEQRPPEVSSPRETSNSVLKSLFLHLKPFQEDGAPQDPLPSGGEEEKRSVAPPGGSKVTRPGPTGAAAPRLGQPGDGASEVNRDAVTPLRDLFKTLDATVFQKV